MHGPEQLPKRYRNRHQTKRTSVRKTTYGGGGGGRKPIRSSSKKAFIPAQIRQNLDGKDASSKAEVMDSHDDPLWKLDGLKCVGLHGCCCCCDCNSYCARIVSAFVCVCARTSFFSLSLCVCMCPCVCVCDFFPPLSPALKTQIELRGKRHFLSNDDRQNVLSGVLGLWNAKKRVDWMVDKLHKEPSLAKALEERVDEANVAEQAHAADNASDSTSKNVEFKAMLREGVYNPAAMVQAASAVAAERDRRVADARARREAKENQRSLALLQKEKNKEARLQRWQARQRVHQWLATLAVVRSGAVLARAVQHQRHLNGTTTAHVAVSKIGKTARGWIVRRWLHAIKVLRGAVKPVLDKYRFRLRHRRRMRAADQLKTFCLDFSIIVTGALNAGWPRLVRRYYRSVTVCQRLVRGHKAVTQARMYALRLLWQRHSARMTTDKQRRMILEWAGRKAQEALIDDRAEGSRGLPIAGGEYGKARRRHSDTDCRGVHGDIGGAADGSTSASLLDNMSRMTLLKIADMSSGHTRHTLQADVQTTSSSRRESMPTAELRPLLEKTAAKRLDTRSWDLSAGEVEAILRQMLNKARQRLRALRGSWDVNRPTRIKVSSELSGKRQSILGKVDRFQVRTFHKPPVEFESTRNPHDMLVLFSGADAQTLKRLVETCSGVHNVA